MARAGTSKGESMLDVARMLALSRTSGSASVSGVQSPSPSSASVSTAAASSALLAPDCLNGLLAVLRMLKIVERSSGLCLFTTQWKWHPHAHAEGVDALVQSFAQFAREIDGGDIVRIQFDSRTSNRSTSNSVGTAVNASIPLTPTQLQSIDDDRRVSSLSEANGTSALEMQSHQSEHVQAVLFHDRVSEATTQRLRVFLEQVHAKFLQLYQDDVAKLQPMLAAIHVSGLTPEETADLAAPFAIFSDVLQNELLPSL